jgi:hypothetical protein
MPPLMAGVQPAVARAGRAHAAAGVLTSWQCSWIVTSRGSMPVEHSTAEQACSGGHGSARRRGAVRSRHHHPACCPRLARRWNLVLELGSSAVVPPH